MTAKRVTKSKTETSDLTPKKDAKGGGHHHRGQHRGGNYLGDDVIRNRGGGPVP